MALTTSVAARKACRLRLYIGTTRFRTHTGSGARHVESIPQQRLLYDLQRPGGLQLRHDTDKPRTRSIDQVLIDRSKQRFRIQMLIGTQLEIAFRPVLPDREAARRTPRNISTNGSSERPPRFAWSTHFRPSNETPPTRSTKPKVAIGIFASSRRYRTRRLLAQHVAQNLGRPRIGVAIEARQRDSGSEFRSEDVPARRPPRNQNPSAVRDRFRSGSYFDHQRPHQTERHAPDRTDLFAGGFVITALPSVAA